MSNIDNGQPGIVLNTLGATARLSRNDQRDINRGNGRTLSPNTRAVDPARSRSRSPRTRRDLETAEFDAEPLLETDTVPVKPNKPPIANPEHDDEDDNQEDDIPYTRDARPGVDDGFFPGTHQPPKTDPRIGDDDDVRSNGGGGINGVHNRNPDRNGGRRASIPFPYAPDFPSVITVNDIDSRIIPDVNLYQHKKTFAQGMMDLALFSANANQLRYVMESYARHPYFYVSITFISLSLILQVCVGVGLILNSRYNVKNEDDICKADRINNFTVIGIFIITVVNVFISGFGVANPPADTRL